MPTVRNISNRIQKIQRGPFFHTALLFFSFFLATFLILCLISRCCEIDPHLAKSPEKEKTTANPENDYFLKVLLLTPAEEHSSQSTLQHLQQTLLPNVETEIKTLNEMPELTPGSYDLIYLAAGLSGNQLFTTAREHLCTYVQAGGVLFLMPEYIGLFPRDFLGISRVENAGDPFAAFSYPAVRGNLTGLQQTWRSFAELYRHYEALEPAYYASYRQKAVTNTAIPLVEQGGLSCLLANKIGQGLVLWSNGFLPGDYYSTRFDFISTGEQPYFHYGLASANYLFHQELLTLVSKEKYGFSIKKSYGPYGRPGLAWQSHYEEILAFPSRAMIKWIDLLADHNQIPTFSLIRGSFRWGHWQSSLRLHLNQGTDNEPVFQGTTDDSFYSAGERLSAADDYLLFSAYPLYKTLLSDIEQPCRPYPQLVDWNGNGPKDLLVGTAEGTLHLLQNTGTNNQPRFMAARSLTNADGSLLTVGSYAAPLVYDYDCDGLFDLLVGDGDGRVTLFLNTGNAAQPRFNPAGFLQAGGKVIKTTGAAAPVIVDWDGDGWPDLLVGESSGKVIFFPGLPAAGGKPLFAAGKPLRSSLGDVQVNAFAAPWAVDWNNNGRLDLLVGSGKGEINLYLRQASGELRDAGSIAGLSPNFHGSNALKTGHNVVPLVLDWNDDGQKDLLTGQLEYGIPYPIDSPYFPFSAELRENLHYARERHIPVIPHLFLHEYLNAAGERREIELHKKAFQALGLNWLDDTGVNHHTWSISRNNPLDTFHHLKQAGVWWDFGFAPPGRVGAPRDGKNFLIVVPFLLPAENPNDPFLLFSPAPNLLNFPYAWDLLASYDLPATYFEHTEHYLDPDLAIYPLLLQKIALLNEFKDRHEYNFMTEEQMARSLLNTYFADVQVKVINEQTLHLTPDFSHVPALAREYCGTLGLKIEPGEGWEGRELDTSGYFCRREANGSYYFGLEQPLDIFVVDKSNWQEKWHIIRSNGPVEIKTAGEKTFNLILKADGLQEIKIFAPTPVTISGEDLKITRADSCYTITHFGTPVTITIKFTALEK